MIRGNTVEFSQVALGLIPKIFNAVYMFGSSAEFVGTRQGQG